VEQFERPKSGKNKNHLPNLDLEADEGVVAR
jgi:hypothetical protein